MARFLIRRILWTCIVLILVNFLAYTYAHYARWMQLAHNPLFAVNEAAEPVWTPYKDYLVSSLKGEMGDTPGARALPLTQLLADATRASFGLLSLAFGLSLALGLMIGLNAVRTDPPRAPSWLILVTTTTLTMPAFYVGATLVAISVYYLLLAPGKNELLLPLGGFGWDLHLVFPTIALMLRPTFHIAQTSAALLSEELTKPYIIVARSFGYPWRTIRGRIALRNILGHVTLTVAGSLRLLVGELIMIEWLFGWPGLGKILASTLQAPNTVSISGAYLPASYLHAPTIAGIVTIITALFLLTDLIASTLNQILDPRLHAGENVRHA